MNEERRSIFLTKEDAIKFYNSDNEALKGIALMAFSRFELDGDNKNLYEIFSENPNIRSKNIRLDERCGNTDFVQLICDLQILANYTNGRYKKTNNNLGFFIGRLDENGDIAINKHSKIMQFGIVYFETEEAVKYAISKIGKDKIIKILKEKGYDKK